MIFDFDLTLHESLAVLVYKLTKTGTRMPETTYALLSRWLGCEAYILPDNRDLKESALSLPILNKSDLFANWHYLNTLETHYTLTEQSNIIRYIQCQLTHASSISPTHRS